MSDGKKRTNNPGLVPGMKVVVSSKANDWCGAEGELLAIARTNHVRCYIVQFVAPYEWDTFSRYELKEIK